VPQNIASPSFFAYSDENTAVADIHYFSPLLSQSYTKSQSHNAIITDTHDRVDLQCSVCVRRCGHCDDR